MKMIRGIAMSCSGQQAGELGPSETVEAEATRHTTSGETRQELSRHYFCLFRVGDMVPWMQEYIHDDDLCVVN